MQPSEIKTNDELLRVDEQMSGKAYKIGIMYCRSGPSTLSILTAIFHVNLMFIEAKDDGGGGDNWTTEAISRAQLQPNHHHQQTNIQFILQTGCLSCRPTNSVRKSPSGVQRQSPGRGSGRRSPPKA